MKTDNDRLPFKIEVFEAGDFENVRLEIKDYAVEVMEEKKLIQLVVDKCHEAGGGTVVINSGSWQSGSIHLYDNICLFLEEGAAVHFSSCSEDYLPVVFTRWEGMECYNYSPLIYANGCINIKIAGKGRLTGGGEAWWHWKRLQGKAAEKLCYAEADGVPVEKRVYGTKEAALRPQFLQLINCKNVILEDFIIEEGPQWTIHPVYCENVIVRRVTVNTTGHNTDGLNPDSCRNVWIEGCTFSTGDDCIAINSGMNEDGWRVGKPCENIVITDCVMNGGHGGIVIGSGMSGGVKNVYAANCIIRNTMQGIRLKSMRGRGGYVRDVWFENIKLYYITNEAVSVSMFYPYSTVLPKSDIPAEFSHIHIRNVEGSSRQLAMELRGLPEKKITDVFLEKIKISAPKAMFAEHLERVSMDDVALDNECLK